jgi:hypothetical protein
MFQFFLRLPSAGLISWHLGIDDPYIDQGSSGFRFGHHQIDERLGMWESLGMMVSVFFRENFHAFFVLLPEFGEAGFECFQVPCEIAVPKPWFAIGGGFRVLRETFAPLISKFSDKAA